MDELPLNEVFELYDQEIKKTEDALIKRSIECSGSHTSRTTLVYTNEDEYGEAKYYQYSTILTSHRISTPTMYYCLREDTTKELSLDDYLDKLIEFNHDDKEDCREDKSE